MWKPLLMMRTRGISGPFFRNHFGIPGLSRSAGNFIGTVGGLVRPISGRTVDESGTESLYDVTICFSGPFTVADYLDGVTLTVGSVDVTYGAPIRVNDCVTYPFTAPAINPGDAIQWCLDNSLGKWTDDSSGEPLGNSCINVTNLIAAPVVLSAVVAADGLSVAVTFDLAVDDDGVFGDPEGAKIYNCTQYQQLSIMSVSGNGTTVLTYVVYEPVYVDDVIEYSAAGVAFTLDCVSPVLTDDASSAQLTNEALEVLRAN